MNSCQHLMVWSQRCEDAEFLSQYWGNGGHRHRAAGSALHAGRELLVPLSLPLWRAPRIDVTPKPCQDSPGCRCLHRLRKIARACPSNLPVDRLAQIRSVECTACMACVAACPAQDALQFSLTPRKAATPAERWRRRTVRPMAVAAVLACIFFGLVLFAKATGHWQTNLPRAVYMDLVSHASDATHPGM